MIRYLDGWRAWVRYLWLARHKKHGAGKQRWAHAFKGASCARYIADGQQRNAPPRWLKRALKRVLRSK